MNEVIMLISFGLAAYSIIANDSIQTLGTFLSSNANRPWWAIWSWISVILVVTVLWGWYSNSGDPAFGRLSSKGIDFPGSFNWLYLVPPLVLVLLTRSGIPVSTSLLVLTAFAGLSALQSSGATKSASDVFSSMLKKSVVGYMLAFVIGLGVFLLISRLENRFRNDQPGRDNPQKGWIVFQWVSTGFLWSMWLVQDLANVFVYLPRRLELWAILTALIGMVGLLGVLIHARGGRIQRVVTEKTNTCDLRSATLIDFMYGLVLLFFKFDYIPGMFESLGWTVPWPERMPMSTTWVFLGLLAGREIGMWIKLRHSESKALRKLILVDLGNVSFVDAICFLIAIGVPWFAASTGMLGGPNSHIEGSAEASADPDPPVQTTAIASPADSIQAKTESSVAGSVSREMLGAFEVADDSQ